MISCKIVENPYEELSPLKLNEKLLYLKHETFHRDCGISGILSIPQSMKFNDIKNKIINEDKFKLPLHKLVLLVHGHQAHKNSNYQPLLAEKLNEIGYYVLRIDFRGLGDSESNFNEKVGRSIYQDIEDLETVYQWCTSYACINVIGHELTLDTIVAHSRGVLSMFEFGKLHYIPNLINCCGRFDVNGLLLNTKNKNPNWEYNDGFSCKTLRFGKFQDIWIPRSETLSVVDIDVSSFSSIDERSWIVSIYGSQDNIVPLTASASYANLFNGRHTLEIIINADHNFYGMKNDANILNLPLKKGNVNYGVIVVQKIISQLSHDNQINHFYLLNQVIKPKQSPGTILSRWPLPYNYSNVSNFRDIGGYLNVHGHQVKPRMIYRCANPCDITPNALNFIKEKLNVNCVFDLRTPIETLECGVIDGITVKKLPFNKSESLSPIHATNYCCKLLISPYMFPETYMTVVKNSIAQIQSFFNYLLDDTLFNENQAIIFHCAAGKDRTGILGMLLLGILDVEHDIIARDYELTTIGLKTEHKLINKLQKRGDAYYDMLGKNGRELANEYHLTPDKMCLNILSSTYESMRCFIDIFYQEFGSFEQFFIDILQFSPKDIDKIKKKLLF